MSWRAVILFTAVICLFSVAYALMGLEPSPLAEALLRLTPPLGAALWVEADARRLRRTPCYELGAFVLFGWPVAVPSYCLWSRGRPGWRVALALLALILAPSLIAGMLSVMFGPQKG